MVDDKGAICMAVYKPDFALLSRQILSIRQQSVSNWICVIGIDGADADLLTRLKNLTVDDDRFVVHEFHNRLGFYNNFERVLNLVKSDTGWVALADQDDFWYPNKLEELLEHLRSASMVLGQARLVRLNTSKPELKEELGTTHREFFSISELLLDNVVSGALSVFRSDVLKSALPFPLKTDVAYHDHWLGLCAALDVGIVTLPAVVQDYVQHGRNVIGEEIGVSSVTRLRSLLGRSVGARRALTYVVNHRWRWRVYMARLALTRFPQVESQDRRVLEAFAADRFTLGLMRICLKSAARGKSSKLRVSSLWIASIFAPAIPEEVQVEA